MDQPERRRTRLAQLLDLAQTYKGWTRKQLARTLGRDPTKLIPGTGIPKLDLVVALAGVLDWPVGDVVAFLWAEEPDPSVVANDASDEIASLNDFEGLDEAARGAHRQGRYHLMIQLAARAYRKAKTPEDRARACNREAGGWDGLGRYTNVLSSVQRGLVQVPVSAEFRRMLQSNLANAYYTLWTLVEARAVASDLLAWYRDEPPKTLRDRKTLAFAHYVSGHTYRRLLTTEPDRAQSLAEAAFSDLQTAEALYRELGEELKDDSFNGIAQTCRGGLIEVGVTLGRTDAQKAISELEQGLDDLAAAEEEPVGDVLESYGWWCIFGCNLALRHLTDERELQQRMAIFTNKADEIAERLDNWSIRERVFTMEHSRWERAVGATGFDIPRVIDEDEVRIITGTMARFPAFRDTGWDILREAGVVRAS